MSACGICRQNSNLRSRSRTIGVLFLILLISIVAFLNIYASTNPNSTSTMEQNVRVYRGEVVEKPPALVDDREYRGVVLADLDCRSIGRGSWTQCRAVIMLKGFLERFVIAYVHDMSIQPCLAPGQKVTVVVSGSQALVEVVS